jgi:Domain of unknown function DUF11
MSVLRLPHRLGAARSLVAVAMLAGAAFSAVPASAATTATTAGPLTVSLSMPAPAVIGQAATYNLSVTNNSGTTLKNVIVGDRFFTGAKVSGAITGLPTNSCVKGNAAFGCLVPSMLPGATVTLTFHAIQSVPSVTSLGAAQAFVGGLFTTSRVTLTSVATGTATSGGGH